MPSVKPFPEWPEFVTGHSVTFVRHGEKAGPGFSADLTERGRYDARFAGSRIHVKVDLFIASPSPRTVSTAECIRAGNGSAAPLVTEDQLAEPGNGFYTEFAPAMRSFVESILGIIDANGSDIIVATTHNFVIDYLADLFSIPSEPSLLCGLTVNLDDFRNLLARLS